MSVVFLSPFITICILANLVGNHRRRYLGSFLEIDMHCLEMVRTWFIFSVFGCLFLVAYWSSKVFLAKLSSVDKNVFQERWCSWLIMVLFLYKFFLGIDCVEMHSSHPCSWFQDCFSRVLAGELSSHGFGCSSISFDHLWFVNPHYHHILLFIYFTSQTVLVSWNFYTHVNATLIIIAQWNWKTTLSFSRAGL